MTRYCIKNKRMYRGLNLRRIEYLLSTVKRPDKIKQMSQFAVKTFFIAGKYMYFYSVPQKGFDCYGPGLPDFPSRESSGLRV